MTTMLSGGSILSILILKFEYLYVFTSSTEQGGGGSFRIGNL